MKRQEASIRQARQADKENAPTPSATRKEVTTRDEVMDDTEEPEYMEEEPAGNFGGLPVITIEDFLVVVGSRAQSGAVKLEAAVDVARFAVFPDLKERAETIAGLVSEDTKYRYM